MHDSCKDSVRIMHEKLMDDALIINETNMDYAWKKGSCKNQIWHSKGWNQKINGSCMNHVWAELGLYTWDNNGSWTRLT